LPVEACFPSLTRPCPPLPSPLPITYTPDAVATLRSPNPPSIMITDPKVNSTPFVARFVCRILVVCSTRPQLRPQLGCWFNYSYLCCHFGWQCVDALVVSQGFCATVADVPTMLARVHVKCRYRPLLIVLHMNINTHTHGTTAVPHQSDQGLTLGVCLRPAETLRPVRPPSPRLRRDFLRGFNGLVSAMPERLDSKESNLVVISSGNCLCGLRGWTERDREIPEIASGDSGKCGGRTLLNSLILANARANRVPAGAIRGLLTGFLSSTWNTGTVCWTLLLSSCRVSVWTSPGGCGYGT
jgi:hypothetical protein